MMTATSPDLQPTLVGETILIRPLRREDWPEMFAAASAPLIWEVHPARDRYKEVVFKEFFDGAMESKSAFAFVERTTGSIIGSSRFHEYDPERSEIEIGWTFLVRAYWGGNTNRQIKGLILAHAFTFVNTVVFWVGESNYRSQRAMEKIGGIRHEELVSRPGAPGPHVVFEITKARFGVWASGGGSPSQDLPSP
jgi:RimJ/RimL family protein N-acetyltransferase